MVNGDNIDNAFCNAVDDSVISEENLSNVWIAHFGDHTTELREFGEMFDGTKDIHDKQGGIVRRIAGNELGGGFKVVE